MANFVRDLLSLFATKSDKNPLGGLPATQAVMASDLNSLASAAVDLRSELTAGQFHGLQDNVSPATSAASGITKLDSQGGLLRLSVNGAAFVTLGDSTGAVDAVARASTLAPGPVGATPNANAASVAAGVLTLQPASASFPGVLTTGAQTLAGAKTFSGGVIGNLTGNASGSAASFTGSLAGDVTGTQGATVVASVGGASASSVAAAASAVAAATALATPSTLVKRDASNNAALNVTGSITQVGGCTAQALPTPTGITLALGTGTLTTGTKYYRVTALWNDGETLGSTETSIAGTGPFGVVVTIPAVTGATGYRIYRSTTTGTELLLTTVGLVTSWTDDGSLTTTAAPAGSLPAFNSTGGLSMPGNQTYMNPSGVRFYSQTTDNTIRDAFAYVVPAGWTGINSAGNLFSVYQTSGPLSALQPAFAISRFGGCNVNGGVGATAFQNFNSGQSTTITGSVNDGTTVRALLIDTANPLVTPGGRIVSFKNTSAERSHITRDGTYTGQVSARRLAVSPLPAPRNGGNAPTGLTGGTLAAGTYYYRIVAVNDLGVSLPSIERSYVVTASGGTGKVEVIWEEVAGALYYDIYGRTTGAEQFMARVDTNDTTTTYSNQRSIAGIYYPHWYDTGAVTPSGALPTVNTSAGFAGGFTIRQLPAPIPLAFTTGTGTLAAGTYYYSVTAVNSFGESSPSATQSYVLAGTGGVNITWRECPGAWKFNIYGRSTGGGGQQLIGTVDGEAYTFLDNGSVTPSGALPTFDSTDNVSFSKRIDARTTDASGTPGAATQNSATGKSAIASGASSVVITNAFCTSSSLVRAWVHQASADATLLRVERTFPGSGSFTVYGNANATSAVTVAWEVIN